MFALEIVLLGCALAMDAAVVSFTLGLLHLNLTREDRIKRGFLAAICFGFFQFLMTWLGSLGGYLFMFSSYGYLYQLVVALVFLGIAGKCIQESFSEEEKDLSWNLSHLIVLSLATSIDALAVGITFGSMPRAYQGALEIGVITFLICAGFYFSTRFFRHLPGRWLLRLAGVVFLILSGQVIHTFFSKGYL